MSKSFVAAWNKYRHEVRAELAVASIESPADIVWAVGNMLWKHSADSGVVARMDKLHVMAHDDAVTYQFDTGRPVAYVVRFWTQSDLFVSVEECISDSLSWKPDPACPRDDDNLGKMAIFDSEPNEHPEKPRNGEVLVRLLALPFYEEESDKYRIRNEYDTPGLKELLDVVCENYTTCVIHDITRGYGYKAMGSVRDVEWFNLQYMDGLAWVANKDLQEEELTEEQAIANLRAEIELYSAWATGAVYDYRITDIADPQIVEVCGGIYDADEALAEARSRAGVMRYVPQWY